MSHDTLVRYPSVEGAQDPFPWLEHLQTSAPVYQEPGTNRFYLTRHEDISYVLRTPAIFSSKGSRSAITEDGKHPAQWTMMALDPPDHKDARKVGFAALKPGRLRRSEDIIRSQADHLIDEFIDRGHADLVDEFAGPLVAFVTCDFLGLPTDGMREVYLRVGKAIEGSGIAFLPPERQARDRDNWAWALEFVRDALRERVEHRTDDGLSLMINEQVERDGEVRFDYLVDQAATIFLGGLPNTVHLITGAMLALIDNPDEMRKITADHSRIPQMLEEALRYHCPVQWNARRVVEDVVIADVAIPAGSMVYLMYGIANRQSDVFECPVDFDVSRGNVKEHLGFGLGIHFCVGAPLARLEGKVAFERLLSRVTNIRLREPRDGIQFIPSPSIRGLDRLEVDFDRVA